MKANVETKSGVILDAAKEDVIDHYLQQIGLPKSGTKALKIVRLHEAMQLLPATVKGAPVIANCSTCRGKSHVDMTRCPFCGDGDADETVKSKRSGKASPKDKVIAEIKTALEKKAADEKQKAEAEKAKTAPSPVPGQELVAVPKGRRLGKAKQEQQAPDVVPESGTKTITKIDAPASSIATEKDLDAAIAKIKSGWNRAAVEMYDVATVLADVIARKLFLQRRGDDQQPKYPTFTAWIAAEMPFMSPQHAYELSSLPLHFTREQVAEIGKTTVLSLSLRIDPAERKKLLESGQLAGMTVREVKEQIVQHPNTEGKNPERTTGYGGATNKPGTSTNKPRNSKDKSKSSAAVVETRAPAPTIAPEKTDDRPKVKPEGIQLITAVIPTRIEFPLFARGSVNNAPPIPAKDFAQDPFAEIECANGIRLYVVFFKDLNGQLQGALTVKNPHAAISRDDEGEEREE